MKVDMSPRAIDARLKLVEQLRRLCLSLKAAGEAQRKMESCRKNEARGKNFN